MLKTGLAIMLAAGALLPALAHQAGAWHYMLPVAVLSVGFAFTLGPAAAWRWHRSRNRPAARRRCWAARRCCSRRPCRRCWPRCAGGELALGGAVIALSLLCLALQWRAPARG
ncbi:Uncharacterised protein [Chromobacterium violaceum]|uniref:Uncharacterized protein n=1 Tax=Chromobacterium violaceum TaxID=536 RepID=A0A3S4HHT5_CHRVL|nr:Uncharacterised protein [Chromobacterium violaceum]